MTRPALTWTQLFNFSVFELQTIIDPLKHVMSTKVICRTTCAVHIDRHFFFERKMDARSAQLCRMRRGMLRPTSSQSSNLWHSVVDTWQVGRYRTIPLIVGSSVNADYFVGFRRSSWKFQRCCSSKKTNSGNWLHLFLYSIPPRIFNYQVAATC